MKNGKYESLTHKPKYENALREFIAPWLENPEVEGVLLVGSYAVGLENSFSDIDICIVMADSVSQWTRGNSIVSGFLIEYSFYPVGYLKQLQEQDLASRKRLRTRMLATGKIIYDKNGLIKELQKEAREKIVEGLSPITKEALEIRKYYLWDQLDNLRSLAEEKSPGLAYAYFTALQEILETYAAYLGLEIPRPGRIYRFLTDIEFCKRYLITEIPDPEFIAFFESAMRNPSLKTLEQITQLVHERMGGFNINGWTITQNVKNSHKDDNSKSKISPFSRNLSLSEKKSKK